MRISCVFSNKLTFPLIMIIIQVFLTREETKCPVFDESCPSITYSEDGCCRTCITCKDDQGTTRQVAEQWQKDGCTTCNCSGKKKIKIKELSYCHKLIV